VTINVLSNDYDDDGDLDENSLIVIVHPTDGTADVTSNDRIEYTPDTGFTGNDSFDYEVCDDRNNCDTATVSVTVTSGGTG